MQSFRVIDSHTGGEPTRTIVSGGPALAGNSLGQQLEFMRAHFDGFRRALVNEPRGSEVMVGAHLVPAQDPTAHAGIIFFNNVGYLGMCGHGTIGVVATLAHLGRISPGTHRFETVVGIVTTTLHEDNSVTVENVASYRSHSDCELQVEGLGCLKADIAYGGNWFCLVHAPEEGYLDRPIGELLRVSERILAACRKIYPDVDHVELFDAPKSASNHSRNFVLCPGGMYDRSPCGTGTSAKIACLAASGKLAEGATWNQESIIGSMFEGRFRWIDKSKGLVAPSIQGRAFVNADSTILIDERDPFAWGIKI
jgi:4-hydroxyproline epimerase